MTPLDSTTRVLAAIERNRRRIWAVCYRMTGRRAVADDLAQEAIARAVERANQVSDDDPTGWLLTVAARVCLDHSRKARVERRATELADPLDGSEWLAGHGNATAPDEAAILREDLRYAIVVALQHLTPRQRAALVLHDVCDRSLQEIGATFGSTANAAKATLHRARVALREARRRTDVDVPVDHAIVERFAKAIEAGAVDQIADLLAEDAWGATDGGGIVVTANKPTFGRAVIARQWANAKRKIGVDVTAELRTLNGEPAIVVRLATQPDVIVAVVHLETHGGRVVALRVNRDPRSTATLAARSAELARTQT
jgi:RNA polymerase sigma factor (sigma-70 family)